MFGSIEAFCDITIGWSNTESNCNPIIVPDPAIVDINLPSKSNPEGRERNIDRD